MRKKVLSIILVLALLIAAFTTATLADNHHITREEFFTALGETLGLSEEDSAQNSFPDYNNQNKIVNAMVNIEYLLGRNDGTLSLQDELSLEDVNYVFSRIKWPEKIVTKTKYVSETEYVEVPVEVVKTVEVEKEVQVEVPVEVPVDLSTVAHDDEHADHLFALAADGAYHCIFKGCETIAFGTTPLPIVATPIEYDEASLLETIDDPDEWVCCDVSKQSASLSGECTGAVASNAVILVYDGETFTPMGFVEFFDNYDGQEICCYCRMPGGCIDLLIVDEAEE